MVAEDVTITEEVLVVLAAVQEVPLQEEKAALLQEEKVQADLEATETQLREKVVSAEEVQLQEKAALAEEVLQEEKALQIELLDVLKVSVIHLDQEDQEKTNIYC